MDKTKIVNYIKQGYPQPTACALARVEFEDFRIAYTNDKDFRLDINEADAIAVKDQIDSLREASYGDYKAALEYLKKRDKANWADSQKLELSIEQGRQEVYDALRRSLPQDLYLKICEYMGAGDDD